MKKKLLVADFRFRHSVQLFTCSLMSDSVTPWTTARKVSLSITNSQSWLKLMSIESVMPSNHLILCRLLLLLPLIFPSISLDIRSCYKISVIKSLLSWSLNKQTYCRKKQEYLEIYFSVDRNLIYVIMIKFIHNRMF